MSVRTRALSTVTGSIAYSIAVVQLMAHAETASLSLPPILLWPVNRSEILFVLLLPEEECKSPHGQSPGLIRPKVAKQLKSDSGFGLNLKTRQHTEYEGNATGQLVRVDMEADVS
ncbi:hypothetical protein E4U15_002730 [Claviceps sp. LM218 group G6]|nr:hypothetical protein E4U15_002730 [Claviceps sp. LM218 group G6]